MAAHKIFLNSGNFVSQKVSYLDVTEEFVSIHMLTSLKFSQVLFPKQDFMEESEKLSAHQKTLLRLIME